MGYDVYDLWEDYLKNHGGLDDFLKSFERAVYSNEQKTSYIVLDLLKLMGKGDALSGIQTVLSNNFGDYEQAFILATKGVGDHKILGNLPEGYELKLKATTY